MKNSIFARFARAFFIFWRFVDVLVLSTTWNDQFCRCVDDVSIWWQMLNFVFLCPKRWLQFNSWIVRTHFSSIMSLNNWKMIAETRSYIFRWRSRFRRRRVCLSSLMTTATAKETSLKINTGAIVTAITTEFMFAGINMFWARLRLILARAARRYYYYYHFGGHWENKHWKKNDNKTVWRIFFSPALWENVNKLWNGFSILIGCLDRTIIWFS